MTAELERQEKLKLAKSSERENETQKQLDSVMQMLADLASKQDRTLITVLDIKTTVNVTLQGLNNFFTREADGVPRLILIGPPSSDFSGSTDKKLNTAMAALSDPKQFAASFMLEKKTATMHILCAHDLSSVVSFDVTEPNKMIQEYAPAIKLSLKALKLVSIGAKLATGLPFPLPDSSSLDSFLEGANDIVGDAFSDAGMDKVSGAIDSGNCDEETKKITGAAYVKLKKYLTAGDGAKMKKIEAAMSKVGCKDGTEQWVSNKNIDAFLTSVEGSSVKKQVGDFEVTVRPSMTSGSLPPPPAIDAEVAALKERIAELELPSNSSGSTGGRQHSGKLVQEGNLEKKGGGTSFMGNTNYKSRYFKLYETTARSPSLFFYADAKGAQKGNVPLAGAIITLKKGSVDEFTISNADEHFRTFNFKAPTAPGRCGRFSSRGWGAK